MYFLGVRALSDDALAPVPVEAEGRQLAPVLLGLFEEVQLPLQLDLGNIWVLEFLAKFLVLPVQIILGRLVVEQREILIKFSLPRKTFDLAALLPGSRSQTSSGGS